MHKAGIPLQFEPASPIPKRMPRPQSSNALLSLLPLLLGSPAPAQIHQSPIPQEGAWFTLDGTELDVVLEPESHRIVERVILKGHFRDPHQEVWLGLHPGFRIHKAHSGRGPVDSIQVGDQLRLRLPFALAGGDRFRIVLDLEGQFLDPARAPSSTRSPHPAPGIGIHLDSRSGAIFPRESYWYPRPLWGDAQGIRLRLRMPEHWVETIRLRKSHTLGAGPGLRFHRFQSDGVLDRPLGLAAGPYLVDRRRIGNLSLQHFLLDGRLAEHPDPSPSRWAALEAILDTYRVCYGEMEPGSYTFVEVAGSLPRGCPSRILGQGSFAWIDNPDGEVSAQEYFFLAREMARGLWERTVPMASFERAGLVSFAALLAVRRAFGEEEFLAQVREQVHRRPGAHLPGNRLLPSDPAVLEASRDLPPKSLAQAERDQLLVLLGYLQRLGSVRTQKILGAFTARYRGRIARFTDLVDLFDLSWNRVRAPGGGPVREKAWNPLASHPDPPAREVFGPEGS